MINVLVQKASYNMEINVLNVKNRFLQCGISSEN